VCAIKASLFAAAVVGVALLGSPLLVSDASHAAPGGTPISWTSVVPAKRVVSGVVGGGCVAFKAGDVCATTASLFPNAPSNVDDARMGVQGGTLENPYCAGDIASPRPAPGYLCIYPNPAESVNVGQTSDGLIDIDPHPVYNGRRGFKITWPARAAGSTQLYAVWAYRAP